MLITSPIFSKLFTKYGRRPMFLLCLVFSAVGIFFLGPSNILKFPDEVSYMFFGLTLIGIGMGGANSVCIPEIIDAV
jgi:MFS family permease